MKLVKHHKKAVSLPAIEGHIYALNHYDAEMRISPSSIRNLQNFNKNEKSRWKDFGSLIVLYESGAYSRDHQVRTDIQTLHQAVNLARLGFDVDLRPYSGKNAMPLSGIEYLTAKLPEDYRKAVHARLNKPVLKR